MKKLLIVALTGFMFFLGACGGKENSSAVNSSNGEESKETVEVEKNLLDVEITIPASFLSGEDLEQVKSEAEQEEGVKDVTINSDGSITYKMSKSGHAKMLDKMRQDMENLIQEIKSSGDFQSIIDIKADKSFSKFTMIVDRGKFENSFDGFAALGIAIGSMLYQAFDGVDAETAKTTINVEDSNSGEVFRTMVYPDDLRQ